MKSLLLLLPALLSVQDKDVDTRIDEFAKKVTGTDETVVKFRKALAGPVGKIVLRDRIEKAAEGLRRRSERDAVPDYFKAHFEEIDGKYRLRNGQEEFRRRLLDSYAAYQKDVDLIAPVIREIASQTLETPEINARVRKLLSNEGAAPLIYLGEILKRTRPDVYTFQKELGQIFTMSDDGKFFVPDARKEGARKYARLGGAIVDTTEKTAAEIRKLCEKLADFDDLHKKLKQVGGDPLFSGILLRKAFNADEQDIEGSIQKIKDAGDELIRHLPDVFQDTPKGKVLLADKYTGVEEAFQKYDQVRAKVSALRAPAREFAGRIRSGDELHDGFRRMFQADIVLTLLDHVGENMADPVSVLKGILDKALVKQDGKYGVPPEKAEEVGRELKDPDAMFRKEAHALRLVSAFGEKVEDPELKKVFTSYYGRYEVEQEMRGALAIREHDGLGAWIGDHFEKSKDGYTLRSGSKPELEAILAQIEKLDKEGRKNDLKD